MKVRGVASFPVVYFVKIFEGFCKVWATSYEEHRLFESYYIALREKTRLHCCLNFAWFTITLSDTNAGANSVRSIAFFLICPLLSPYRRMVTIHSGGELFLQGSYRQREAKDSATAVYMQIHEETTLRSHH